MGISAHYTYTIVDIEEEHGLFIFNRHFAVVEKVKRAAAGRGLEEGVHVLGLVPWRNRGSRPKVFLLSGRATHSSLSSPPTSTHRRAFACVCTAYRVNLFACAF